MTTSKSIVRAIPDYWQIVTEVRRAFDALPLHSGHIPVFPEDYADMAFELFNRRTQNKTATAKQISKELNSLRLALERVSKAIRSISSPTEELIENQIVTDFKVRPETAKTSHFHVEAHHMWQAVCAAQHALGNQQPTAVKQKKGRDPEALVDDIADMAALDYWRVTQEPPARVNDNQGNVTDLRGNFPLLLKAIFTAMGITRSVDDMAKKAAARFNAEHPCGKNISKIKPGVAMEK